MSCPGHLPRSSEKSLNGMTVQALMLSRLRQTLKFQKKTSELERSSFNRHAFELERRDSSLNGERASLNGDPPSLSGGRCELERSRFELERSGFELERSASSNGEIVNFAWDVCKKKRA